MRTTMQFLVSGKTKDEIESKILRTVTNYLQIEEEDVKDKADVDILITVSEEEPGNYSYAAQTILKVR